MLSLWLYYDLYGSNKFKILIVSSARLFFLDPVVFALIRHEVVLDEAKESVGVDCWRRGAVVRREVLETLEPAGEPLPQAVLREDVDHTEVVSMYSKKVKFSVTSLGYF